MYTVKISEPFTERSYTFQPTTKYEFETKNFGLAFGVLFPNHEYRVNNILHRENGPAIVTHYKNGLSDSFFYTHGKLTRQLSFDNNRITSEVIYENDLQIIKIPFTKVIDEIVYIKGHIITVCKDMEEISEKFEAKETPIEAAERDLKSLDREITDYKAFLGYRYSPRTKNLLSDAKKRYERLALWLKKNKGTKDNVNSLPIYIKDS